ncbi:MAG: hypothetical protein ACLR2E_05085 [Lachnospiraceae bacterium]
MEKIIHKSLPGIFDELPADRNPGFIVQKEFLSVKINGVFQIDDNAAVAEIETGIHF